MENIPVFNPGPGNNQPSRIISSSAGVNQSMPTLKNFTESNLIGQNSCSSFQPSQTDANLPDYF
jgi:hypothetical protein